MAAGTFTFEGNEYTVPSVYAQSSNNQLKFDIGSCLTNQNVFKIAYKISHNNPRYNGAYYCPVTGDNVGYGDGGPNDGNPHFIKFQWKLFEDNVIINQGVIESLNVEKETPQAGVLVSIGLSSLDLQKNYSFSFDWDQDSSKYQGYYGWDAEDKRYCWVNLACNLNLNFDLASVPGTSCIFDYIPIQGSKLKTDWESTRSETKNSGVNLIVKDAPNIKKQIVLAFEKGNRSETYFLNNCEYEKDPPAIFMGWTSSRSLTGYTKDSLTLKTGTLWQPGDIITSNFLGGNVTMAGTWKLNTEKFKPQTFDFSSIIDDFDITSNENGIWQGSNGVSYPIRETATITESLNFYYSTDPNATITEQVWIKTETGWEKGFLWIKTDNSTWQKSKRTFVKRNNDIWQHS